MSYLIDTDALSKRDEESIRLIDANAIDYNDYWWHKGYSARDCQQAAKLISEQPTIEAIPIEYIQLWIDRHNYGRRNGKMMLAKALNELIAEWRKANETD